MEIVVPEILADVRQLSTSLCVVAFLVGGVLWIAGWSSHRFWVVLGFTIIGGIWGLQHAEALYAQPLVAAIGVALGAGILALTLVRLVAFTAGGYAGLVLIHTLFPSWDQPLISVLAGGLLGFFLFRFWTMALTSLAGIALMAHSGLVLAEHYGKLDTKAFTEGQGGTVNLVCGALAALGFFIQLGGEWLRRKKTDGGSKGDKKSGKKEKASALDLGLAAFRRAS
jgi:hypothetical protein